MSRLTLDEQGRLSYLDYYDRKTIGAILTDAERAELNRLRLKDAGATVLVCPCGGTVEERGHARVYTTGDAVEMEDGERKWLAGDWTAPIETYEPDEPPFHCTVCDAQLALADLVPAVEE